MSALSVADVLDAAADLIQPEGAWQKGSLYNGPTAETSSCFCMAGATLRVSDGAHDAWGYLDRFLRKVDGRNNTAAFNDAPERTQAEVVAKLREAAAKARETGN